MHGVGPRAAAGRLPLDWSEQAAYMYARGLSLGFAQFLSLLVHTAHARMGDAPPTAPIPRAAAAKEPAPTAAAAAAPSHAPARAAAAAALPAALSSMLTGLVLPP